MVPYSGSTLKIVQSYINDKLLKQLIRLDGGDSEDTVGSSRSVESNLSRYKITVGALVQLILHSRTLKLSSDNLKVFKWILNNFVNTTVKEDVLNIMERMMNELSRRHESHLKDVTDLWSRFPSTPIVLYSMNQKYGVKCNYPKPIGFQITETVDIPYLRDKLLPRSAHGMFCIPSEPFSAEVRSDARQDSKYLLSIP